MQRVASCFLTEQHRRRRWSWQWSAQRIKPCHNRNVKAGYANRIPPMEIRRHQWTHERAVQHLKDRVDSQTDKDTVFHRFEPRFVLDADSEQQNQNDRCRELQTALGRQYETDDPMFVECGGNSCARE